MIDEIVQARARAEAAAVAAVAVAPDYAAVNKLHRKQKAALTRAINSGNAEQVQRAVAKAVREWRAAPYNNHWPDDWSRWQVALNDTLHWRDSVDLADIR